MYILITTSCCYAGTDEYSVHEVNDNATEDQINEVADELALERISPCGYYEVLTKEEAMLAAQAHCCDIEDLEIN